MEQTDPRGRPAQAGAVTAPPRDRHPRVTRWLFVALVAVHTLAVVLQPVLAGAYLGGDIDAIGLHATVGITAVSFGLFQVGAGLLVVRPGFGPWWLLWTSSLVLVAEGFQLSFGFERQLGGHVPLGVLIVASQLALLVAVWRWRPGRAPQRSAALPAGTAA